MKLEAMRRKYDKQTAAMFSLKLNEIQNKQF